MMALAELAILIRYLNIFVLILDFACEGVCLSISFIVREAQGIISDCQ